MYYARISNGPETKILETYISENQIKARNHTTDVYVPMDTSDMPTGPGYNRIVESFVITEDSVKVSYKLVPLTLDQLFNLVPKPTEGSITTFSSIDIALFAKLAELITDRVQDRLDTFAAERNYGDKRIPPMLSACSFSNSTNIKFRTEGEYCVLIRDLTWAALCQYIAELQTDTVQLPLCYSDIEALLPIPEWPEISG